MFILRLIGSILQWLWYQFKLLLCPFAIFGDDDDSNTINSTRRDGYDAPSEEQESSVTQGESFHDFVLQNASTSGLRLCLFYFCGYLTISVISFSFLFERWSIVDSLYFAVILFTTTGYGDVQPTNDATRLFIIFFALSGVTILGIFISLLGKVAIEWNVSSSKQQEETIVQQMLRAITRDEPMMGLEQAYSAQSSSSTPSSSPSVQRAFYLLLRRVFPMIVGILVICCFIGYLEGWSFLSSAYFAVISISTIGLGDVTPTLASSRLVVIFFLPIAVGIFGETVGQIASLYLDHMQGRLEKSFMMKQRIMTLTDLNNMDINDDGMVSSEEFVYFLLVALGKCDQQLINDIRKHFETFDLTDDGYISKKDLIAMSQEREGWSSLRSTRDMYHDVV